MALSALFVVGLGVAVFVGFNVGGSNIGVAFGPATGASAVSKTGAAALMTLSFFLGGWTVGRGVVRTMGGRIVPSSYFTPETSVVVLFFIGFALFLANIVGVPASTSMTGVGSIAGLGLASDALDWVTMGEILTWWLVSPVVAFWVSAVVGRYCYSRLASALAIKQTEGSLFELDRRGALPRPRLGTHTTRREAVGTVLVVAVACYTAFSAGTSNAANAIAPLVGAGTLAMEPGLLLVGGAVGLGAFTIGRRTIATMGEGLTEMPLLAALVVAVVSSTLVTVLSWFDIPVSVVIIATMSIVGLGWGRATRSADEGARPLATSETTAVGEAVATGREDGTRDPQRAANEASVPSASELFEPATTAKVIALQNLVPTVSTIAAYLVFRFLTDF